MRHNVGQKKQSRQKDDNLKLSLKGRKDDTQDALPDSVSKNLNHIIELPAATPDGDNYKSRAD